MKVLRDPAALRSALSEPRSRGLSIGMVPTMGALHEGHLSLIREARRENDVVVVSIFVNPKQFGPNEDFAAYPRDEQRDLELAREAGADLIYAPAVEAMYPEGFATTVEVTGLTEVLCGAPERRGPDHFRGVTTVVCKLLNAAWPDRAYFGQKDAQQVAVIKRMVRDLDMATEIRVMPIVREPDGLAMSSRNAYLGEDDRRRATAISGALAIAQASLTRGESLGEALDAASEYLRKSGIEPEYLEARDPETLAAVETLAGRPVLVAVAARVGPARLIDNFIFDPRDTETSDKIPALQGGRAQ